MFALLNNRSPRRASVITRGPARSMRSTALPLRDVDDRERVIEGTGHIGGFAVGCDRQAAGIDARRDHGRHELGSLAEMIGQNVLAFVGRRLFEQPAQPFEIHDRDPVGSRAGDQGKGSIGRDGDGGRVGEALARLIEQHLVHAARRPRRCPGRS